MPGLNQSWALVEFDESEDAEMTKILVDGFDVGESSIHVR